MLVILDFKPQLMPGFFLGQNQKHGTQIIIIRNAVDAITLAGETGCGIIQL
jgi:hypothetical protein